ncbi:MarR family winged helix-turn-helix transcriptional regulator [Tropicibacter naphthalenivorans]|uniref:Salmolysin n=1 Tax=Tropicibacter naphthalenivorans TaxID=441103 RepID=A0A0P1GWI7_9RHOB|nr:MarR family transcriptional regulator [Tropicibacter naphthalenivorans]CUH81124.1 Salmolysin [Tropicibacter naphthalenivorans]SMC97269.1 MarR family protein [Tropicibacter naphthalenivorans]
MSTEQADPKPRSTATKGPLFQDIARFRGIVFDALLRPHDITMSQGWAILHLVVEDGLRQADLAERLDIATVTTSKLIDRLEARGFVERQADPDDRRSKRLYPTDKARAVFKTMTSTQREVDAIANAGIDTEELLITLKVLGQMRANLKAAIAGGIAAP